MITITDLWFSYTGLPPFVLEGLHMEIHRGEYISVVGENGSGKSTLMRLLLGLLKPGRGEIRNEAARIGYVPQKKDFNGGGFPITVRELLNSYRKLCRIPDKGAPENVLKQVGMEAFRNSLMGNLSGGQMQKVFIARALMGEPDLLILDEPSTGIDRESQQEIYGLLRKMNQESGLTILSVEHNLDAAVTNSTQIYHLAGGKGHLCSPDRYMEELIRKEEK